MRGWDITLDLMFLIKIPVAVWALITTYGTPVFPLLVLLIVSTLEAKVNV